MTVATWPSRLPSSKPPRITLPGDLTFNEAHARYTPETGSGMTLRQAEAFVERYTLPLRQLGERVAAYVASEEQRQGVWLYYYPDDVHTIDPIQVWDAVAVARHLNRLAHLPAVTAGYVHFRVAGGVLNAAHLKVEWQTERVFVEWRGRIRPPAWGVDATDYRR